MKFSVCYLGEGRFRLCHDVMDDDVSGKLRTGGTYTAEIRLSRNAAFHRKYFKMLSTAWEFVPEAKRAFFGNSFDSFRETVEIAAGCSRKVFNLSRKEWEDHHKSVSFSSMSEDEFRTVYERVRDVLLTVFLKDMTEQQFERILLDF